MADWTNVSVDDSIDPNGSEQAQSLISGTVSDAEGDGFIAALLDGGSGGAWRIYEASGSPYEFSQLGQDLISQWELIAPSGDQPPARSNAANYSGPEFPLYIFGGVDDSGTELGDFWQTFNGSTWTQLTPTHLPPARQGGRIAGAYIAGGATFGAILFGGTASGVALNDTWAWNGTDWTELFPTTTPPARYNHTLTSYFRGDGYRLVMCGGSDGSGVLDDTWVWETYLDWSLQAPSDSPSAREGSAGFLIGFGTTEKPMIFGGNDGSTYMNDQWEWSGSNWSDVTSGSQPTACTGAAISNRGVTPGGVALLFGGKTASGVLDETWEMSSDFSWGDISDSVGAPPSARAFHAFIDPLFSGTDGIAASDDVWSIGVGETGIGSLARVGSEIWFSWLPGSFFSSTPRILKYDNETDMWIPVGDGGGPGSQFESLGGGDASYGPSVGDGYVAWVRGGDEAVCFKWVDPDWVLQDPTGSGTFLSSFWGDPTTMSVVADPTDGDPVVTSTQDDAAIVVKFDSVGQTWHKIGGADAISNADASGIESAMPVYWLVSNPEMSGQFAVVTTDASGDGGPKVAFGTATGFSAPVEASATDTTLWDGVESPNPRGGSAWATAAHVYCAVKYEESSSFQNNVQAVRIPWGGTTWEPVVGSPPANSVMLPTSDFVPDPDYSAPSIAVAIHSSSMVIGVLCGTASASTYRFFYTSISAVPVVDARYAVLLVRKYK